MRGHNFDFGKNDPVFVTASQSAFKKNSTQRVGIPAGSGSTQNSQDIRKTHFIFGKQSPPSASVSKEAFQKKV
jgi:hypothetical protein